MTPTYKYYYLAKFSGSYGIITDFSRAEVIEFKDLLQRMRKYGYDPETAEFEYKCFDERIGFHTWYLVAKLDGYDPKQFFCFIYSTTDKHPYLTEHEDCY